MGAPAPQAMPRKAGTLPFPERAVGSPDPLMPFDHLVVVMMENHSFDNLLGYLPYTHPQADGLTIDGNGVATNQNLLSDGTPVVSFPLRNTAQQNFITQSWKATREQVDGGAMDGVVRTAKDQHQPMGYYTPDLLPFAYSLARTFTVANRWFCSAPGPTYPNRRFMLAGTAFGLTETSVESLLQPPPPNGTIFDQLSNHHVTWADYSTEIPMTLVIPTIFMKYLDHHHSIEKFFHDGEAGSLPAVSFVDPALGALRDNASSLPLLIQDALRLFGIDPATLPPGQTEENPDDLYFGERWAFEVTDALMRSPAWERTLLIYTYDEHGGYYDHVPPALAVAPDQIAPEPAGTVGDYTTYGPRVPAVVMSPYSKPGGVTNELHDHTSILATIERKWNLPALTARDANAATVMDFLDLNGPPRFAPPPLQSPPEPTTGIKATMSWPAGKA
jgi:phospholipase C